MRRLLAALAPLAAGLAAAFSAHAGVGFQMLSIPDPQGPPIEVGVWYPTEARAKPTRVGPFEDPLAAGAPVSGRHLPLVVMSHGNGGYFGGHHDTALALAEAGFVAAALTHTGDNYQDQSKATQVWERPRQLKLLTDYMLTAWPDHDRIDAALCGLYLLVVLSILFYAIRTCLEAYRASAPTVREEPALAAAE